MRSRVRSAPWVGAVFVVATAVGFAGESPAQTPALASNASTSSATLEVASIKQNKAVGVPQGWRNLPDGFTATNTPIRTLLRLAYGYDTLLLPSAQILGGPAWVSSDRFDVTAKANKPLSKEPKAASQEMFAMLRTILESRFQLKVHLEKRELSIFTLVKANENGKLGEHLTPTKTDCVDAVMNPDPSKPTCGFTNGGVGVLMGRGVMIGNLTAFLQISPAVGRVVRDGTGLTGRWDFRLEYAPPFIINQGSLVPNPAAETGVSLLTALKDQLGLKLEAGKGPVDILIIDHIETLSEDK